ncbi:MAG: NUDIX domain-containing protein [Chloroflexi bacterium]|nr:NUDIX domain-containing protein [Chloroflexota bacterium]
MVTQSGPPTERHVVTCFLWRRTRRGDRILLLQRSQLVSTYRGRWAAVSGTVETTPDEQAYREVAEETGLSREDLTLQARGEPLVVVDPALGRRWVVHPYLFEVADPARIRLDWEHTRARWLVPGAVGQYATVPGLAEALAQVYPPPGS